MSFVVLSTAVREAVLTYRVDGTLSGLLLTDVRIGPIEVLDRYGKVRHVPRYEEVTVCRMNDVALVELLTKDGNGLGAKYLLVLLRLLRGLLRRFAAND